MILVDDGSTDDTVDTAFKAAAGDPRIRIEKTKKAEGAGGARNTALGMARGRYIAFLDADDLWDPTKLKEQIDAMQTHGWVFSWTSYRVQKVEPNGKLASTTTLRKAPTSATRDDILSKKLAIGCLTAIYDADSLGKTPMKTLPKRQDFVLWIELAKKAEKANLPIGGLAEPLATYRLRKDSLSGNKISAARWQWKALVQHCGVTKIQAVWLFISYAIRGIIDRTKIAMFKA